MTLLDTPRTRERAASSTSSLAMGNSTFVDSFTAATPVPTYQFAMQQMQVTRSGILQFAWRQLIALANRQKAARLDSYVAMLRLVNAVTPSGASPTPQIGDNGDGGIVVEWLVSGRSLIIDYIDPMEIYFSAVAADGTRLFDDTLIFSWHGTDEAIVRSHALLAEMATEIRVPIKLA